MQTALTIAREAAEDGEVPVGAVIVKDGEVIAVGRNRREKGRNALAHAEIEAIDGACKALGGWRLSGCTLYVTLEPCPMCAGAIINSRIDRVVYGTTDPKPTVTAGVLQAECADALQSFFRSLRGKKADS